LQPAPIAFHTDVMIEEHPVRLADIADLSTVPAHLRARASNMVVAPARSRPETIPLAPLVAGLRARMPVLGCWLPRSTGGEIRVHIDAARTQLSASEKPMPRAAWQSGPSVQSHDRVNLEVAIGAVRIERRVEALQPARPGQRLFVRDADGKTLSVLYAEAGQ